MLDLILVLQTIQNLEGTSCKREKFSSELEYNGRGGGHFKEELMS